MSLVEKEKDPQASKFDYGAEKTNGQFENYPVLPKTDRDKGFVRPVRASYKHVGSQEPTHPLRDLTEEEKERHKKFGYVKYEKYPEGDPVVGRFWTQGNLDRVDKGCGVITTMNQGLAETYARDPYYYGSTFCCGCGKHLPVNEFVWTDTCERVGS